MPQSGAFAKDLKILTYILIKVAEAIKFLHQNDVAHGDLKPGNILISVEGKFKLTDLGSARKIKISDSKNRYQFSYTMDYLVPEPVASEHGALMLHPNAIPTKEADAFVWSK